MRAEAIDGNTWGASLDMQSNKQSPVSSTLSILAAATVRADRTCAGVPRIGLGFSSKQWGIDGFGCDRRPGLSALIVAAGPPASVGHGAGQCFVQGYLPRGVHLRLLRHKYLVLSSPLVHSAILPDTRLVQLPSLLAPVRLPFASRAHFRINAPPQHCPLALSLHPGRV